MELDNFAAWMELAVHGFEALGVLALIVGSLVAVARYATRVRGNATDAYKRLRQDLGRAILMGVEILIIADLILTITIDQTIESAVTLGIVVLVRTFLSFSLEIELEGTLPWRRPCDDA